ncbi:hypothetical protein A2U01_0011453 [Trifolium medium]|uniref:Uncharacterized protein n=1 Tax=Trifolium medium TaxID=97028 RepID=A0A392MSP8_9FABA|nr:hypothetical protein [Trifolium medium]
MYTTLCEVKKIWLEMCQIRDKARQREMSIWIGLAKFVVPKSCCLWMGICVCEMKKIWVDHVSNKEINKEIREVTDFVVPKSSSQPLSKYCPFD